MVAGGTFAGGSIPGVLPPAEPNDLVDLVKAVIVRVLAVDAPDMHSEKHPEGSLERSRGARARGRRESQREAPALSFS
jgi:hypothetical protein